MRATKSCEKQLKGCEKVVSQGDGDFDSLSGTLFGVMPGGCFGIALLKYFICLIDFLEVFIVRGA